MLRIWHLNFDSPGAFNEKTIPDHSRLFSVVCSGCLLSFRLVTSVSGQYLNSFYYLADGIYPDFRIFVKPLGNLRKAKEKLFSCHKPASTKAVERVFGEVVCPFPHFVRSSSFAGDKSRVVIHNMICATHKYTGTTSISANEDVELLQSLPIKLRQVANHASTYAQAREWRAFVDGTEPAAESRWLHSALIDHIWNMHGEIYV